MPETVITTGTSSNVVHVDPDCPILGQATGRVREIDRSQYPDREVCKFCTGRDVYTGGSQCQ